MRITQPREDEPIRLVATKKGPRYRAVLGTGTHADGRRRQVTKTFDTITDARDWVAETRTQVRRGTYQAPDRTTFDGLCESWLASRRDIRQITVLGYEQALKSPRTRIGHRHVQDLTRADMDGLVTWLAEEGGQRGKGLSHRSIVYTIGTVRQVLDYGVANGLLINNPATGVRAPRKRREDHYKAQVWDVDENGDCEQRDRFREAADMHPWAAGYRLTLCGLRRSEVLGLRWEDVNFADGTISIRQGRIALDGKVTVTDDPKSARSWRTIDVETTLPGTMRLLRNLRKRQASSGSLAGGLVLTDDAGAPARPEAYSDQFASLCREAGVPVIKMHATRHVLALIGHFRHVPPVAMAAYEGHSVEVHLAHYLPSTETGTHVAAAALAPTMAQAQ